MFECCQGNLKPGSVAISRPENRSGPLSTTGLYNPRVREGFFHSAVGSCTSELFSGHAQVPRWMEKSQNLSIQWGNGVQSKHCIHTLFQTLNRRNLSQLGYIGFTSAQIIYSRERLPWIYEMNLSLEPSDNSHQIYKWHFFRIFQSFFPALWIWYAYTGIFSWGSNY